MVTARIESAAAAGSRKGARPQTVVRERRRQLVCSNCGYGISVHHPPERCPMCRGSAWRKVGAS